MRPKIIGVVGGAGPLAGVMLVQYLFQQAQQQYACQKDSDFPKVILLSYPFSDMLSPARNERQISDELQDCINALKTAGAEVICIACNTLHAYLVNQTGIVNLIQIIQSEIQRLNIMELTVLCTSTAKQHGVHRQYFNCRYLDDTDQLKTDRIIDRILANSYDNAAINELNSLIDRYSNSAMVLGCTELSQVVSKLQVEGKIIIDPLLLAAKKIISIAFKS